MRDRLSSFLRDNRAQIIELWITEADLPPPYEEDSERGSVPICFLEDMFEELIVRLHSQDNSRRLRSHLSDFAQTTFTCRNNNEESCLGCIEIRRAGENAFASVLSEDWDADHEFTLEERANLMSEIRSILAKLACLEMDVCLSDDSLKKLCPFSRYSQQQMPASTPRF